MQIRKTLSRLVAAGILTAAPLVTVASQPANAVAADPVVIIPGLFGNGPGAAQVSYTYLQQRLAYAGYDAEIFVAPDYGTGDIHANAARLATFVDNLLAETGAAKVDIVAHSQGGIVARDYVKTLGGAAKVDSLVMSGTPNHGAENASLATAYAFDCVGMVGCQQIAVGSSFLTALNEGDDSIGAVRYTSFSTPYDTVMTPWESAFLNAGDGNITNVNLQQQCPWRWSDHMSVTSDGAVIDGVVDVLANRPVQLDCFAF